MNCSDHDNESLPYCPQCLAQYWEKRYHKLKRRTLDSATEAAYRVRFMQKYTRGENSDVYKMFEGLACDIEKWNKLDMEME